MVLLQHTNNNNNHIKFMNEMSQQRSADLQENIEWSSKADQNAAFIGDTNHQIFNLVSLVRRETSERSAWFAIILFLFFINSQLKTQFVPRGTTWYILRCCVYISEKLKMV